MKYIITHPPIDMATPFPLLHNNRIRIYFHHTNKTGGATCGAACDHCYLMGKETYEIPIKEALAITSSLREQGYQIGMTPADSFSEGSLSAGELTGSAFHFVSLGTSAWTSGVPIFVEGWEQRLVRAWEIGFRSIIISAHESAGTLVPIRGVTKRRVIEGAIAHIHEWNREYPNQKFTICATFTIRKDNCDYPTMEKMVKWGISQGVSLVRFNGFNNFLGISEHEKFEMSEQEVRTFFGHLAKLQEKFMEYSILLGVSEDVGDTGIEQIIPYLPPHRWQSARTGWCAAGYRLFAMIEVEDKIVLVGCVDKLEPVMGRLDKINDSHFVIKWDYERIEKLRRAIVEGNTSACWWKDAGKF